MAKFTAKQIRRFYALRKAKAEQKQQWKLKENDINSCVTELLTDAGLYLQLYSNAEKGSTDEELISYVIDGLNNLSRKIENNELRLTINSKSSN